MRGAEEVQEDENTATEIPVDQVNVHLCVLYNAAVRRSKILHKGKKFNTERRKQKSVPRVLFKESGRSSGG